MKHFLLWVYVYVYVCVFIINEFCSSFLRFIFSLRFLFMLLIPLPTYIYVYCVLNPFIASGLYKNPFMLIERRRTTSHVFVFGRQILCSEKENTALTIGNYNYGNFTLWRVHTVPGHLFYEWICLHETKNFQFLFRHFCFALQGWIIIYFWYEVKKNIKNLFSIRSHLPLRAI